MLFQSNSNESIQNILINICFQIFLFQNRIGLCRKLSRSPAFDDEPTTSSSGIDGAERDRPATSCLAQMEVNIFGCFPFLLSPFFPFPEFDLRRIKFIQPKPHCPTPWPIEFAPLKGLLLLTVHEIGFPSAFKGMGHPFPLAWGNLVGWGRSSILNWNLNERREGEWKGDGQN